MDFKITLIIVLIFTICRVTAEIESKDPCDNGPADVVFVLDASSSIWPVDFMTQLKFVQNLTKTFNIGPSESQTRVAILTFSSSTHVEFNLNDKMDMTKLQDAIHRVRHLTGGTNTADAIDYVADKMFLSKNGGRSEASHIVIVITDGESYYKDKTAAASKKLREQGVTVFAIGVGSRVDLEELKSIASSPPEKYVLEVFNYRSLKKIQEDLTKRTCEVTQAPPVIQSSPVTSTPSTTRLTTTTSPTTKSTTTIPTKPTTTITTGKLTTTTRKSTEPMTSPTFPTESAEFQADREKITKSCGGKPSDVFFLLDTSGSISPTDFVKQLDFVQNVVNIFDISPDKTRVGVSTFSHAYNPMFGLDKYYDKTALVAAIRAIPYSGGGTDTGYAIKRLREHEFSRQFTRPEVAHVVIVLTDGLSRYPDQTAKEAALMKKTGTYVFAVGIGNNIDQDELSNIASAPDSNIDTYAFHVNNFDGLNKLRNILAIKTCEIATFQRDERVCKTTKISDVMFVYDAAYFGQKVTNIILDIVEQVSMYLATTGGTVNTGILSNACLNDTLRPLSVVPLEVVQDYDALPKLISDLRFNGFSTRNGGRQAAMKNVVLFVDSYFSKNAELEVLRSKFRKINFIFVQFDTDVADGKLVSLAVKPYHVILFNSGIQSVVQHLNTLLCEGL